MTPALHVVWHTTGHSLWISQKLSYLNKRQQMWSVEVDYQVFTTKGCRIWLSLTVMYTSRFLWLVCYIVGLILCSTALATASWNTTEGAMGYTDTTVTEATAHELAAEYPHSTLNSTPTAVALAALRYMSPCSQSGGIWKCLCNVRH